MGRHLQAAESTDQLGQDLAAANHSPDRRFLTDTLKTFPAEKDGAAGDSRCAKICAGQKSVLFWMKARGAESPDEILLSWDPKVSNSH
ncbi:hypothetical protein HJFPF1_00812 [Paramyrothecium foliicola]|nr:hypothetical protein HJFPF1_00812 [Paramyrothecium foliicola]